MAPPKKKANNPTSTSRDERKRRKKRTAVGASRNSRPKSKASVRERKGRP